MTSYGPSRLQTGHGGLYLDPWLYKSCSRKIYESSSYGRDYGLKKIKKNKKK